MHRIVGPINCSIAVITLAEVVDDPRRHDSGGGVDIGDVRGEHHNDGCKHKRWNDQEDTTKGIQRDAVGSFEIWAGDAEPDKGTVFNHERDGVIEVEHLDQGGQIGDTHRQNNSRPDH